jgi:hypothetical protein
VIEWFYRKIFVAIVPDDGAFEVRLVILKRKKLLSKESRRFEGIDAQKDMLTFLRKRLDESPLHYIAVLNPDPNQGALLGCSLHDISEALSSAKTLCRNHKWLLYASIQELDGLKKEYSSIGLDFIFSPFSVIEHFFGDKISGGLALYALALKDSFSVAFFEEGKLEFAHHYPLHRNEGEALGNEENVVGFSVGIEEDSHSGINLDDIESLDDLDIIDELDDLSDIEDLDSLEEIVDFREDEPTTEEARAQPQGDEIKGEMDRFNEDYKRFELIEKILSRFYGSEECHNRFIETVYIADAYGSGSELKQYLEDELFLNVLVRRIDIADEVISLAMDEEG